MLLLHHLLPFLYLNLQKMPKITQFDKHGTFAPTRWFLKTYYQKTQHILAGYAVCPLKTYQNQTCGGQKKSERPQKHYLAKEKHLNPTWLRKRKTSSNELRQDLRDASSSSVDPSAVCQSLIRNGLNERVADKQPQLRKRKRGQKAEV